MTRALTPGMVAERWACKESFVRNLIKKGDLEAFAVGKLWRISEAALEEYEARPAEPPCPCDVYVIRCQGFVKIGKAAKVESRIATLRIGNPFDLELIAHLTEGDGHALERALHQRFAAHRHRFEWFREEGELAAWVEAGCPL